jgi:hypothetical protein
VERRGMKVILAMVRPALSSSKEERRGRRALFLQI